MYSHHKFLFISIIAMSVTQLQIACTKVEPSKSEAAHLEHSSKKIPIHTASEDEHDEPSLDSDQANHHASPKHNKESADSGTDAKTSFRWLNNGNNRFVRGKLRNDGQSHKDRKRLEGGQKPHAIILSCSDSRVPPEVLFDQKLGEIFVVRTAGEALDSAALASIEYAVEHLGSHLLVVMAHESCGAVKAAYSTLKGQDAGSPSLNKLVQDIHPRLKRFMGHKPTAGFLSEAKANASGVARDLVGRSQIIAERVENDQLSIETAVYHLGSGRVEFYTAPANRGLASEK
jgi:carbonic anhydrase